jgi:23S rRNA (uridine2552-2'-O)-methyltransferase
MLLCPRSLGASGRSLPASGARRGLATSDKKSSAAWLRRQAADPFVRLAREERFRSRSAFKLLELDERFQLLRRGASVVDLGAAPGGWSQVAARRVGRSGRVVMSDALDVSPIVGCVFVRGDFLDPAVQAAIVAAAGGSVDAVLCDMAPNTIGMPSVDHSRQLELASQALEVARQIVRRGGAFVAKIFTGPEDRALAEELRRDFAHFSRFKPAASRDESREMFFCARGFKGRREGRDK